MAQIAAEGERILRRLIVHGETLIGASALMALVDEDEQRSVGRSAAQSVRFFNESLEDFRRLTRIEDLGR